jgi:hypothetical protein
MMNTCAYGGHEIRAMEFDNFAPQTIQEHEGQRGARSEPETVGIRCNENCSLGQTLGIRDRAAVNGV